MGRYFSDELFHFVGFAHPDDDEANYATLKLILQTGCISHPPHTSDWGATSICFTWEKALVSGMIIPAVVCFADIPVEHLSLHVAKHGAFGLSLPRQLLARYGARPVMYIPLRSDNRGSPFGAELLRDIEQVYRRFQLHILEKTARPADVSRRIGKLPGTEVEGSIGDGFCLRQRLPRLREAGTTPNCPMTMLATITRSVSGGNSATSGSRRATRRVVVAAGFEERLARDYPQYASRLYVADDPVQWSE